jgi:enamine deaminase RidA (YjgF/YER057c/UK114 family)
MEKTMTVIRSIRTPIMHRVVEVGPLVFVGGTIADDTKVGMGDQTRNILTKIEGYLGEVGLDRKAIVQATIFVTDLSHKKEMDAAWTEFFGEALPTRATVGVADLGGGALIEVVTTATRG